MVRWVAKVMVIVRVNFLWCWGETAVPILMAVMVAVVDWDGI